MTGNVLVVTAINFDPKLNTITNMLIQNLAFTDICMASLHMPFWVISLRYGRWVFNHVLCQLVGLTQLTFGITSLFTMTGIAFNRYFNVVRRNLYMKYFSTKKVTYFVIAAAWLGALAVTSPQLYGWGKIAYHPLFAVCTCIWDLPDVSFMVFLCAGTIFSTASVISWCYYTIYKTVKASAERMQGHAAEWSHGRRNAVGGKREKTERKVLKTSFVVVCVFLTCWTPLSVVGFIEIFGSSTPRWVHLFSYFFVFGSSLTNPFIYGIMNPQFQQAFKKLLRFRANEIEPMSSTSQVKENVIGTATTMTDVTGLQTIGDEPSTSIQPGVIDQNQNQVKHTDAPTKPLEVMKAQAWK